MAATYIADRYRLEKKDIGGGNMASITALLAALYGVKIRDKNYKKCNIKIAFNPLTREFEVWSKTYDTPEWIKDISKAWQREECLCHA